MTKTLVAITIVVGLGTGVWFLMRHQPAAQTNENSQPLNTNSVVTENTNTFIAANANTNVSPTLTNTAVEPIVDYPMTDFFGRITKKHFGQYITPASSPVQPEQFSGYHTAVDLETTPDEQNTDVPVYAIADGTLTMARTASGYGGVMLVQYTVDGKIITAVYGHIRLSSVTVAVGTPVTKGERLAYLGTGYSSETDGERMHLHFGLLKGASTNIRGYVASQADLSAWYDPEAWFREKVK